MRDFQFESLKLIALRMAKHLPHYISNPQLLERGVTLAGELAPCELGKPARLLVCTENSGAQHVANEVAREGAGGAPIDIQCVSQREDLSLARQQEGRPTLLLYLNDQVSLDSKGSIGGMVREAMNLKIPITTVHEQDRTKGGCEIGVIYDQTPEELALPPHNLWETNTVPLYPEASLRTISLRHILLSLGARPLRRGRPSGQRTEAPPSTAEAAGTAVAQAAHSTVEADLPPTVAPDTEDERAQAELGYAARGVHHVAGVYPAPSHLYANQPGQASIQNPLVAFQNGSVVSAPAPMGYWQNHGPVFQA
jgi:hypothetical protein